METIRIPDSTIRYILLQRSQYLRKNILFKILTYIGLFKPFLRPVLDIKSSLFASRLKKEYHDDMKEEYLSTMIHLPRRAKAILDIGCGIAGIDIFLSRHYRNKVNIYLLDKSQMDQNLYFYFEKKGSFYNSLQLSKKVLEDNGVDPKKIYTQEATEDNRITFRNKFDIIISLLSWGFHYPVSVYLDEAYKKLEKGGIMIIDVRKNTDGEKEIKEKFGNCKIILDSKKYIRVLAQKKPNSGKR